MRPQERIAFSVGEPVTSAAPPSYRQKIHINMDSIV